MKRAATAKGRIGMAGLRQRKPYGKPAPRTFFHLVKGDTFKGVKREL